MKPAPFSSGHRGWNPVSIVWLASAWIGVLCNWPLWQALNRLPEMSNLRGRLFMLGFCGMVVAVTAFCLGVLAWHRALKPVAALFLLTAAAGAYFMNTYGIVIDPSMMRNVLQTDPREARDLLSWQLCLVLLLGALPLLALWRAKVAAGPRWLQARHNLLSLVGALALAAVLLLVFFADMSATMRNNRSLRYQINPFNAFYSLGRLVAKAHAAPDGPVEVTGADAQLQLLAPGQRPPLLVLVIGETARASNFSLNGYARKTNPELAALDVLSFRQVTSCGTNTAASVPCMFSSLGKSAFEADTSRHENLLDVVRHAGMAVLWLDNQAGCKGVCDRVPNSHADTPPPGMPPPPPALCPDGECLDEALLHGLDTRIAALPPAERARGVLVVTHQMGSHGPAYSKRSPPDRKAFLPECTTNVLQQCERQSVVNAYDNSILYTDHMLAETIAWLRTQQQSHAPALLYISDHGESLGESNIFLHGMPYAIAPREQTHVPMIFWTSHDMAAENGLSTSCLRQSLDTPLSHDNLFHTTLGLLQVHTATYKPALDAFLPCRTGH